MAGERQRCDCELGLDEAEATTGDLPLVCVRCGEATDSFYPAPLDYGRKRFLLRLPLCRSHQNRWRWRAWARRAFGGGVVLAFLGLALRGCCNELRKPTGGDPLTVAFFLIFLAGTLVTLGSLGPHIILAVSAMASGIRIKQLSRKNVILTGVAPEFVEAHRAYRRRDLTSASPPHRRRTRARPLMGTSPGGRKSIRCWKSPAWRLVTWDTITSGPGTCSSHCAGQDPRGQGPTRTLGIDAEQVREACRAPPPLPAPNSLRRRRWRPPPPSAGRAPAHPRRPTPGITPSSAGHLILAILHKPENRRCELLLDLGVSPEGRAGTARRRSSSLKG